MDKIICPTCGRELVWQSDENGSDVFSDMYPQNDNSIVATYGCN